MSRYKTTGGIECPNCGCKRSQVTNTLKRFVTWKGETKTHIRRRKQCCHCGCAYYSVEVLEDDDAIGFPDRRIVGLDKGPFEEGGKTSENPYLDDEG